MEMDAFAEEMKEYTRFAMPIPRTQRGHTYRNIFISLWALDIWYDEWLDCLCESVNNTMNNDGRDWYLWFTFNKMMKI